MKTLFTSTTSCASPPYSPHRGPSVTTQLDAPFSHPSDHCRLDTLFNSKFDLSLATRMQHTHIPKYHTRQPGCLAARTRIHFQYVLSFFTTRSFLMTAQRMVKGLAAVLLSQGTKYAHSSEPTSDSRAPAGLRAQVGARP